MTELLDSIAAAKATLESIKAEIDSIKIIPEQKEREIHDQLKELVKNYDGARDALRLKTERFFNFLMGAMNIIRNSSGGPIKVNDCVMILHGCIWCIYMFKPPNDRDSFHPHDVSTDLFRGLCISTIKEISKFPVDTDAKNKDLAKRTKALAELTEHLHGMPLMAASAQA